MQHPHDMESVKEQHQIEHADRRVMLAGIGGLAAGVLIAGTRSAQAGPLQPPAGPVTSTGKTLTDVEPRRVLRQSDVGGGGVLTLPDAGSYYLGENITGSISFGASNITLDLNGFTLTSDAGLPAIQSGDTSTRNTVRNGRLRFTSGSGTETGVLLPGTENLLEDLHVIIEVAAFALSVGVACGGGVTIRRLRVANFTTGIRVTGASSTSLIQECYIIARAEGIVVTGSPAIIQDCTALGGLTLSNVGISSDASVIIRRCVVSRYFTAIVASATASIEDCIISTWILCGARVGPDSRVHGCQFNASSSSPAVFFLEDGGAATDNLFAVLLAVDVNARARCLVARNTISTTSPNPMIINGANSLVGPIVSSSAQLVNASPWANVQG